MRNLVVILFVLFFSIVPVHAGTITPRLQQAIDDAAFARAPTSTFPVIIHFQSQVNIPAFTGANKLLNESALRALLIKSLQTLSNASVAVVKGLLPKNVEIKPLWAINAISIDLPATRIIPIAALLGVNNVDLDVEISLFGAITGSPAAANWNLNMINVPKIWSYGYTGQGVVIASMDSGVDINHPDIQNKYRGGTNSWFDPYGQHATPADVLGHGTQTMGIMVGGDAGGSSIGVAPGAQWIAVKIFNDAGVATLSAIHQGFQWLLDPDGNPDTDDAPDVVNNSWGLTSSVGSCDNEFINDVEILKSLNISVVFAAGNSGPAASTSLSPANYVDAFAVGATDEFSNVAFFSSRGPSTCENDLFPDVIAPGVNVRTSNLTFGGAIPNSYINANGTSFAAPHVAATIALIKSAQPGAVTDDITAAMRATAVDILPAGPDTDSGFGLLDAQAAYFQFPIDTDNDGVFDGSDNCILIPNSNQIDSNGDGYGNRCDADLNGSGTVNVTDYSIFGSHFQTSLGDANYNPDADFDSNGVINVTDYSIFGSLYSKPPGPSALVP